MKKLIVLFVFCFGLFSFGSQKDTKATQGGCCTATVYYYGEPVASFTNCGIDLTLACNMAKIRAQAYINEQ